MIVAYVVIGYLFSRVPLWLWAMLVVFAAFFAAVPSARSDGAFAAPDWEEYFTSLMMPDNPTTSCCGAGDAYFADKTESCKATDGSDCALVAIITDERPDVLITKSGREIHRLHIAPGTRIVVPRSKLRHPPSVNVTDHNVIFTNGYITYCWEPVAGL